MITVKHLLEQYELMLQKDDVNSKRLWALAEQGLLDEKKVPMLKRSLEKSPEHMTMAEKKSLTETVDALISVVDSEQLSEAKQNYMSKMDNRLSAKYPPEGEMPTVIILQRKAIRVFPDNQKIGLYYSQALDRYVSIPFDGSRNVGQVNEEVARDDEILDSLKPKKAVIDKIKKRTSLKAARVKDLDPSTDVSQHQIVRDASPEQLSRLQSPNKKIAGAVINSIGKGARASDAIAAGLGAAIGARIKKHDVAKKKAANIDLYGHKDIPVRKAKAIGLAESFKERVAAKRQEKLDEALPLLAGIASTLGRTALAKTGKKLLKGAAKKAKDALFGNEGNKDKDSSNNFGGGDDKPLLRSITGATEHQTSQAGRAQAKVSNAFSQQKVIGAIDRDQQRQIYGQPVRESTNFDVIKAIADQKDASEQIMFAENSVTINNRVAKKVMKVYNSLNEDNKQRVQSMINEDIVSFRKVINFAVRQ